MTENAATFATQNEKAKSEIVSQIARSCAGLAWTTRAGGTLPSRSGRNATFDRPRKDDELATHPERR